MVRATHPSSLLPHRFYGNDYISFFRIGRFRQYDYGYQGNLRKYEQPTPPDYDLSKVTIPIYLFTANNDWLSSEQDVANLESKLPNLKATFLNEYKKFNHADYLYATNVTEFLYDNLLRQIDGAYSEIKT